MEDHGILLVDDDPLFLMLLTKCFLQQGMAVHCADNGGDALHIIRERSIALLVTDLQMTGMSGLELAGKARDMFPDLKIVLCSGALTPEVCNQAEKNGITQVMHKPVRFVELLTIVKELVSQHLIGDDGPSPTSQTVANGTMRAR